MLVKIKPAGNTCGIWQGEFEARYAPGPVHPLVELLAEPLNINQSNQLDVPPKSEYNALAEHQFFTIHYEGSACPTSGSD